MIHVDEILRSFSIISSIQYLLQVLTKVISMALNYNSSCSSSSSSWMGFRFLPPVSNSCSETYGVDSLSAGSLFSVSKSLTFPIEENSCSNMYHQENSHLRGIILLSDDSRQGNLQHERDPQLELKEYMVENSGFIKYMSGGSSSSSTAKIGEVKGSRKTRRRPTRIVVPETFPPCLDFGVARDHLCNKEFDEVQGRDFFLASRRGSREFMEDGYGVITDLLGDPKQAYFGVFDGHGGRAAVDYVTENLGKNIVASLMEVEKGNDQVEQAIRKGYFTTDKEFLIQDVSSGACAATVLLKDGKLYVANVGDCRVVLSRKGVAHALTSDHRVNREDERFRIKNSGGYVHCRNGIWRIQGSLAVSRAIGDIHLKEWVVSEPETKKLCLTSDCELLILASDGLWDKVTNQEAVDVALRHKNSIDSCRRLIDLSSGKGNKDDVTIMVVNLQNFVIQ